MVGEVGVVHDFHAHFPTIDVKLLMKVLKLERFMHTRYLMDAYFMTK